MKPIDSLFWPLAVLLLGIQTLLMVSTALDDSPTFDEGIHLAAGYLYWKTGDYRLDPEHPPLGRILNALPLLATGARLPGRPPAWDIEATLRYQAAFLYENHVAAGELLWRGRSVTIVLTLVLGFVLALWTRKTFGAPAALLALLLYALDPNLIAHGRYVTTDLVGTLFVFLAVILWTRFLEHSRKRDVAWAGLALGGALSSKFSAWFLPVVFVVLWLLRYLQCRRTPKPLGLRGGAAAILAVSAIGLLVVFAVYLPATIASVRQPEKLAAVVERNTVLGRFLHDAGTALSLPAHPLPVGLNWLAEHAHRGHQAYLLGRLSMHGWWYYFPVAFAVKTPLAVLLLLAAALLRLVRASPVRFQSLEPGWLAVSVAPVVLMILSMTSPLNIGLRHVLPLYPFLFVAVSTKWDRPPGLSKLTIAAIAVVAGLSVVENVRAYPNYLGFFNSAAGGMTNGPRYLLDSNIDWGQDLIRLHRWLLVNDSPSLCLRYFGAVDPARYGIRAQPVPRSWQTQARERMDCVAAVSVSSLFGLYEPPGSFAWLRERAPSGRVGSSFYVYDLRRKPAPLRFPR